MSLQQETPINTRSTKPFTVSELTQQIKNQLETNYPTLAVQGELSNFKRHSSGHLYFSLKDEGAQIQAALFQASAQKLSFEPKDGDQVVIRGQLSVYSQRGQYQIIARHMEKVGMGEILLRLEALKNELKAKGWFDSTRKKLLPTLPDRIGVVTSPTGAVIRDILHVLTLRHPGFHLILYPSKVQGSDAAQEVAAGVRYLNAHNLCDVIIIARGGGSFEDLMPFNELSLLQAVYNSKIPVISAVGHETDFTLCDFVADFRAPTPSAAAERVLLPKDQLQERLINLEGAIKQQLISKLNYAKEVLRGVQRYKYFQDPQSMLYQLEQQLDETSCSLTTMVGHKLSTQCLKLEHVKARLSPSILQKNSAHWQQRLDQIKRQQALALRLLVERQRLALSRCSLQLQHSCLARLKLEATRFDMLKTRLSPSTLGSLLYQKRAQLENAQLVLQALSPQATLQRGYAIVRLPQGKTCLSASEVSIGDMINIQLADGNLEAITNKVTTKQHT